GSVTSVQVSCAATQYTVTASVSGGNGTITPPSQQVNHGGSASFTVTPATGYHVASVAGDTCTVTGSGMSYSAANVTQACAVVATFAINQYAVTASVSGGNGTITPPSQQVNHGSTASFTVAPAAGYHAVLPLGGTCPAGTLAGSTYTTAAVTAACTISVTFARNPPHHLAFLTPLADVGRGNRLGAAQVAIVDEQGAVIATDSTSQITLTTQACGASVTLGQATVSNGVATFPAGTSGRFFTLANGRTITAGSGSLGGSATVNVVANADLAFADDFELCRL
uniref:InlB B-repeat-containing protein n=1 Tax=Dokdonella sp. TaxID=2291710 RepID=UPI002608FC61